MRTAALLMCLLALQAGSTFAGTVVRDHVTNSSFWDGEEVIFVWDEIGANDLDAIAATSFIGNGEALASISGLYGNADSEGTLNAADWDDFDFRVIWYENVAAFISNPRNGTSVTVFDTPTNPDYLTVVGADDLGGDLFRFDFDVSGLAIPTTPGETHLVAVIPTSSQLDGTSGMAFSNGIGALGSTPDWFFGATPALGPDTFDNLGAPHSFAAYRVTTSSVLIPEPGTLTLVLLGFIFLALRGRCSTPRILSIDR